MPNMTSTGFTSSLYACFCSIIIARVYDGGSSMIRELSEEIIREPFSQATLPSDCITDVSRVSIFGAVVKLV